MHMVRAFEDAGAGAGAYRGPDAAEEVRPPERQEARRSARHGGQGRGRRQGAPRTCSSSPAPMRRRARASTAPWRAPSSIVEAGADAIFPEALTNAEMFRAFAKAMPGVKLLANMTEFGRTPFFTASEFEAMGYKMVIWPVSALRVANKAQEKLYARPQARRRHAEHGRPRCRRAPSSTRRSATTSTRRSTPRSSRPSCRRACRSGSSARNGRNHAAWIVLWHKRQSRHCPGAGI